MGDQNPSLIQPYDVRCLPAADQQHKIYWDHDQSRFQMYTTGFPHQYIDNKYGITMEDLENLSMR